MTLAFIPRRGVALAGMLLLVAALVGPSTVLAGGNGAVSFTQTIHGAQPPLVVGPTCATTSGTLYITGNQVFHATMNKAGDVWVTNTEEGSFLFVPDDPTLPNYTGHLETWFGVSLNANNSVTHDIANVKGTATDGSGATVEFHLADHLSISASGQINSFSVCQ